MVGAGLVLGSGFWVCGGGIAVLAWPGCVIRRAAGYELLAAGWAAPGEVADNPRKLRAKQNVRDVSAYEVRVRGVRGAAVFLLLDQDQAQVCGIPCSRPLGM